MRDTQFNKSILIVSAIIYIIHLFRPAYLDFYNNKSSAYLLSVIYDIAGIILFNNLFRKLLNKKIRILTHIGTNSMVYYITHSTFFYLLYVAHTFSILGWHLYIISIFITILFLIIMDYLFQIKRIRWVVGG